MNPCPPYPDISCAEPECVPVNSYVGIIKVRQLVRSMFPESDYGRVIQTEIMLIVNELGTNINRHADKGEICIARAWNKNRTGVCICASDTGPGIADMEKAFTAGHSEDMGLGRGLNVLQSVADKIDIKNLPGAGLKIRVLKWID